MGNVGWLKLKRSMRDHPLWNETPFSRAQAWVDLLLRANFTESRIPRPGRNGVAVLKPGELIVSLRGLVKTWGWSLNKVLRFLRYLKAEKMIATTNESSFTRVRILNWMRHQHEEIDSKSQGSGSASVSGEWTKGDRKMEAKTKAPFQQGKPCRTEAPAEAPTKAPSNAPTETILRREEEQQQEDKKLPPVNSTSHIAPTPQGTPEIDREGFVVVPEKTGTASEVERAQLLARPHLRLGTLLLEEIGVGKRIAPALGASHSIRQIYDVCEAAKKQMNPGGWARDALEGGWTVPPANGEGLAKLIKDLEAEVAARAAKWARAGGLSTRAPDCPSRLPGELERDHMVRVNEWMKGKKSSRNADSKPGNGQETGTK